MKNIIAATVIAVGLGTWVSADMRGQIETGRSAIATQRKALITNAMQLNNEQSQVFWPLYNEYQEAMRKVGDQRVTLITDYAKNFEKMTDEKATALLKQLFAVDAQRGKVREQFVARFQKILPGRTVARFFQADNKIDAYISASIADEIPLVPTPEVQKLAAQEAAAKPVAQPAQ